MEATIIGIDLAKNSFQLCGVDKSGKELWQRQISRSRLIPFIDRQSRCVIAMEACGGAQHWGREFQRMGFEVKLVAPQFVKPFVKSQKNDYQDALAICEAASRPQMRFSSIKTVEEQDVQSVHRYRELLVAQRTMVMNHARGLLSEFGLVFPKGANGFFKNISLLLENEKEIPPSLRNVLNLLTEQVLELSAKIKECEKLLGIIFANNPLCAMFERLPGIGKITATALLTVKTQAHGLKNGREFSSSLGLIPRQNSTGGKDRLLGITKRGDGYLRKLLVHGARASLRWSENKSDSISVWAQQIKLRRGANRAAVALANKNARLIWAIIKNKEDFVWVSELAA